MAAVSHREKVTLVLLVFTVLFGILGLASKSRFALIRQKNAQLQGARQELRVKQALVNSSPLWNARYEKVAGAMPVFPLNFDSTTYWGSRMDAAAAKTSGFNINKRLQGEEKEVGDAYEFTLEVREYEGTLESIAKFLYELESDGSKFSIRELDIRPHRQKPGLLQGKFTLCCAYMKAEVPAAKASGASASAPAAKASDAPAETPAPAPAAAAPGDKAETPASAPAPAPEASPEPEQAK